MTQTHLPVPTNEIGHAVGTAWTQGFPWDPSEWSGSSPGHSPSDL